MYKLPVSGTSTPPCFLDIHAGAFVAICCYYYYVVLLYYRMFDQHS
jgi:hypothetical protein